MNESTHMTTTHTHTHLHLLNLWINDSLADELSHTVTFLHSEVHLGMVEQHHTHIPSVVAVYHSGW